MPREVDLSSVGEVGGAIVAAVALGMATVVVDFTRTILCATAGIRELILAHRLAGANEIELRVVVPAKLMPVFRIMGLEGFLSLYPTLPAALSAS
jgi:anti-anti-sigma regulatory factor